MDHGIDRSALFPVRTRIHRKGFDPSFWWTVSGGQIHSEHANSDTTSKKHASFQSIVLQIMVIDIVFSLDSVITAVGMAQNIAVMIVAVVISMLIMLKLSGPISDFVDRNPTIKILALAFLILIGVMLIVESMGGHVSKGYIYFAMAFSLVVELLNLQYRKKANKS
jgi:predicted tellurium resistance membrane protein TerC